MPWKITKVIQPCVGCDGKLDRTLLLDGPHIITVFNIKSVAVSIDDLRKRPSAHHLTVDDVGHSISILKLNTRKGD